MQAYRFIGSLLLALTMTAYGWSQPTSQQTSNEAQTTTPQSRHEKGSKKVKKEPGPGRQVANGAGNIAAGAGKGAGAAAKGTGKGALDLVTLHPVDAAGSVGKGAGTAGKDVGVGTAKGAGKIFKGIGRGIKHIF